MILYHIGYRPAQPVPRGEKTREQGGKSWDRWWLKQPVTSGVFLTPDWRAVAIHHMVDGHVYCYETPQRVIQQSGGIHRHDNASEILIPHHLWPQVKFLGKSIDSSTLHQTVNRYSRRQARQSDLNSWLAWKREFPDKTR